MLSRDVPVVSPMQSNVFYNVRLKLFDATLFVFLLHPQSQRIDGPEEASHTRSPHAVDQSVRSIDGKNRWKLELILHFELIERRPVPSPRPARTRSSRMRLVSGDELNCVSIVEATARFIHLPFAPILVRTLPLCLADCRRIRRPERS